MQRERVAPDVREFQQGGILVIGDGETIDELQTNGRWIGSEEPTEVRQ
jgi:hypothetical protein